MANLKEVRGRIRGVKSTQKVTKAMKMVSAAKLRRAQDRIVSLRPYAQKLREIINNVTAAVDVSDIPSPLVDVRPVNKVLVLLVTSNRGLAGPFNANLLKHLNDHLQAHYAEKLSAGQVHIMALGKKGFDYYRKRGFNMVGTFAENDVLGNLTYETVEEKVERVFELYRTGAYDEVLLVFNEFRNVMSQNRIVETLLPLSIEAEDKTEGPTADYIFEPDRTQILLDLIPQALKTQVFRAVLESNAAEQGARMVAMDTATNNADELLKSLRLTYNKARQAAITTEILEISAGADALEAG